MNNDIPPETVRTMGALLVIVFEIARDGVAEAVERMRPLVEPPEDMRVTSSRGVIYTGVLLVERGEIIAGIVIEVGRVSSAAPAPRPAVVTPPPRYEAPGRFESLGRFEDREGKLPGWGEDPRDLPDEDVPWRRR